MYVRYGSYTHPANEVNIVTFDVRRSYSPRRKKMTTIYTVHTEGELLADTQSSIDSAISSLVAAYANDGFAWGFYTDAGALTRHRLPIDNFLIDGPRVIHFSHPVGDAAEFAVKRTFAITLRAEYLSPESQLVAWKERVEYVGNCGPRFEIVETFDGPVLQLVNKRTSQKIIQSGSAVGLQGYILPPGPLLPTFEHQDQRRTSLDSATVTGSNNVPLYYESSWTYTHTSDRYREVAPVTR